MPSDEELRKVAEDMRALARSLARDFWEGRQAARGGRRYQPDAFRRGIRHAMDGARSEFRHGMRYGWGPPAWRYGPPGPPPGHRGSYTPRRGQAGPPWGQPGWWSPGSSYRPPRPTRPRRPAPPQVRRKWDASLLAGVLVVVFGVAWLLSGLGVVHLAAEVVLAAGLMLLGAFLIVTARTDWSLSRHAWPVVLGALLVITLFATSSSFGVPGALSHLSFGHMRVQPDSTGTVYGGFGQLTVDARHLQPGDTLNVQNIAGETRVDLPSGETAVVQGKVLAGQVCVDGHSYASGVGASSPAVPVPAPSRNLVSQGQPDPITIYVHQLAGQVVIGSAGCHS